MKTLTKSIVLFVIISFLNACTNPIKQDNEVNKQQAKHIILIGSDGFGAYAFNKAKVPNLRKMMANGCYSLETRSVLPSSSAVNWASMIMGSGPELHGFTEWGSKTPELPSRHIGKDGIYPSIFSVIDEQLPNLKKGVSYSWGGIGYLFEKSLVDLNYNGPNDENTVDKALDFILNEKPVFTFIHVDEPDGVGHNIGHNTPEYYDAVEKIDTLIGKVINTLEKEHMMDDSIIIFSSDHGGIGKGHGGKTLLEVEIPWIIYGKNIAPKGKLNTTIITYDTAATIAHLLGLEIPEFWRGKAVRGILNE